jgi:hypothetical protein
MLFVSLRIVSLLAGRKSNLVELVNKENVSAIRIMADRLDIPPEEVRVLIDESLSEGTIQGSMTDDGERFFKSDIKLSEAPVLPSEDRAPEFLDFDTRPGLATSILGLAIIAFGLIANANAMDMVEQNFGAIVIFVGMIILFSGMYCLSRRKTPA